MTLLSRRHLAVGGSCGSHQLRSFRLRLGMRFLRWSLLVLAILTATHASGMDGSQELIPKQISGMPPVVSSSGLSYRMDSLWIDRYGYRPLRFEFQSALPVSKDWVIDVTVFAADVSRRIQDKEEMVVKKRFTLPAGQTAITGTVLLPFLKEWNHLRWEVAVDEKVDPLLASQIGIRTGSSTLTTITPRVGAPPRSSREGEEKSYEHFANGLKVDELHCEATEDWLVYSGADVVRLHHSKIKLLAEKQPKAFLALRRWLLAGGSLWIEQVTDGKEGLKQIEQLLGAEGWDFGVANDRDSLPVEGVSGWRYESLTKKSDGGKRAITDLAEKVLQGDLAGVTNRLSGADSRGWYALRGYGFGQIMAFSRSPYRSPARLGSTEKSAAVNQWKQRSWPSRHGLALGGASRNFGNLLIPGVGIAPVTEFQFLITLFVLGIGPLNYWLLRRSQRLHLLVITTPLAALVVTIGLFAYALLCDGLGVKTRARSVTLINQETDEATSWSRVSQYAASAPAGGYVFPSDAAIYPILPTWGVMGGQSTTVREIVWSDGEQQLVRGWLPTRTAVQHLIVRSHDTTKGIHFSADGKEASNRLGADIELLLVHSEAGDWLRAEGVAEGAATRLDLIEKRLAIAGMRLLVSGSQPEFPLGAGDEAGETLDRFDDRVSRRRRNRRGSSNLDENLLNKAIARISGLDGREALDLPLRSYVAVTRQAVETPLGLRVPEGERVKETGSFHVIVGRW